MMIRSLVRPRQLIRTQSNLNIHNSFSPPEPPSPNNHHDFLNFFISSTNCIIVASILWGFESYHEKIKILDDMDHKINDIVIAYKLLEKRCITRTSSNISLGRHLTHNPNNS